MKDLLSLLAALLLVPIYGPYLAKIRKGTVTVHAYSWAIWTVTTAMLAFLQLTHGVGPAFWPGLLASVFYLACAVSAMAPNLLRPKNSPSHIERQKQHFTPGDTLLLFSCLAAAAFWYFLKQPVASVLLLATIDFVGFIPTFRMAWSTTSNHGLTMYFLSAGRCGIALLAVSHYNVITVVPFLPTLLGNPAFMVFVYLRKAAVACGRHATYCEHIWHDFRNLGTKAISAMG